MSEAVKSFRDLEVYNTAYEAMLTVFREVLPCLPAEEKHDLTSQFARSTKAVPRLIAEGHSKRHQKRGFQKYIDDAMAESNESNVSVCQVRDLYGDRVERALCERLIDTYDKISRQLYKLGRAWSRFADDAAAADPLPAAATASDSSRATAAAAGSIPATATAAETTGRM